MKTWQLCPRENCCGIWNYLFRNKYNMFVIIEKPQLKWEYVSVWLLCILVLTCLGTSIADDPSSDGLVKSTTPSDNVEDSGTKSNANTNTVEYALNLYRRLFRQKRASHIEAVKKIISFDSRNKQHQMLKTIFKKLFVVLKDARVKLMEYSFTAGDIFPSEEDILDEFSMVLENTAFLGDLALRLPDVTHSLLDDNSEWKELTAWAVAFTNDSHIFIDKEAEHINLMAQELGFIEKQPSFINPYKEETLVSQVVDIELERILAEQKRKLHMKEKRELKKKLNKGPRMTVQRHTEL